MRVMFSEEEVLEVSSAKVWSHRNENNALVDLTLTFGIAGEKDEIYCDFNHSGLSEANYGRAKAIIRELAEKGYADLSKDSVKKISN